MSLPGITIEHLVKGMADLGSIGSNNLAAHLTRRSGPWVFSSHSSPTLAGLILGLTSLKAGPGKEGMFYRQRFCQQLDESAFFFILF